MLNDYRKISWEFPHGTYSCINPVDSSVKIIYDKRIGDFYVFNPKGKDAIPKFAMQDFNGKIKNTWSPTKLRYMASRICIEEKDGSCKCIKSRFTSPMSENAKDILDVNKASLSYAIETGLKPEIVPDYEVF